MTTPIDAVVGSGGGGSEVTEFYVDTSGAVILDTDTSPGTIASNTRIALVTSGITTPNGDTLDNYDIVELEAQVYLTTGDGAVANAWCSPGIYNTGGTFAGGVDCLPYKNGDEIVIQSGKSGVVFRQANVAFSPSGQSFAASYLTTAQTRVKITASK